MSSERDGPRALVGWLPSSAPGERLVLHRGPLRLVSQTAPAIEAPGQVTLFWRQGLELRWAADLPDDPDAEYAWRVPPDRSERELHVDVQGQQGHGQAHTSGTGRGWMNKFEVGQRDRALDRLVAHWVNLPRIAPTASVRSAAAIGELPDAERWQMQAEGWDICIDARPDLHEVLQVCKEDRTFAVTHAMQARRVDGTAFTGAQAEDLLDALQLAVSFALGRWSCPAAPCGYTDDGDFAWSAHRPTTCRCRRSCQTQLVRCPDQDAEGEGTVTNRDVTGNSEHERIQRAYQRGHAEGRQQARHDLLPFTGVNTAMIAFPDVQPIHQAVIDYEATLTKALPALIGQAHHALEEQRRHAEQALRERDDLAADLADRRRQRQEMRGVLGTLARARGKERDRRDEHRLLTGLADQDETFTQRCENAAAAAAEVEHELALVRAWLDTWVDAAQEYAGRRADLRRETTAPPPSVRIYPSAQAFADEDPRRASPAYESLRLGGADFGYRWTWQDVEQPWRTSKWRVSWLGNLGEVYAVLLEDDVEAQHWQPLRPEPQAPVWLLKTGLRSEPGTTAVWDWLASLERRLQTQRNSLLALAEALDAPTPLNDDEGLARHERMDETSAK